MGENYVITIARGYGSGGRTVGKMLAKELDIPFYDRELFYLASEDSGINLSLFGESDEKIKKGIFSPSTHKYTGELIPPESSDFVSNENLFNYQAKIIRELAESRSCVIVGRCADYVLRDFGNLVDVLVWAPPETCVRNIVEIEGLSEKEAERKIKKIDKHRSDYYRYYTGHDWNDVRNYSLCINSGRIGFQKTAQAIRQFAELKLGRSL